MSDSQLLFGKYRVVSRIGGGGMGEVFRVRKDGPAGVSRELALKRILPEVAAEPRFLQLFLREARALSALNHRGIVQMFEFGSEDGGAFLVMEYLDGVNLSALVRRWGQPFPWPAAVFIGIEIAHALAAAHRLRAEDIPHGLVHGDLSPSNIMICTDGAVKLLDFGLARPAGLELSSSRVFGKLSYLPPEAIAGVPPSAQLDVYALGVILYELLTGHRAFQADNDLQRVNLILHAELPPPSSLVRGLPPELDALLLNAIHRDRTRRFQSCEQLAAELETLQVSKFGPGQLAQFVASVQDVQQVQQESRAVPPLDEAGTTVETASATPTLKPRPQRFAVPAALLLLLGGGAMTWALGRSTPAPSAPALEPAPVAAPASTPEPLQAPEPPVARTMAATPPATQEPVIAPPPKKRAKKKRVVRKPESPVPEALSPGFLADPFEGR